MSDVRTINLSKLRGIPRQERAGKAVREIRQEVARHYKVDADSVKIGNGLNEELWERGAGKAPKSIRVQVIERADDTLVEAADVEYTEPEPEPEPEPVEDEPEETVEDEVDEDVDEEDVDEEPDEETADEDTDEAEEADQEIPEDVREALSDGNIGEGKEAIEDHDDLDLEAVLEFEEAHKDRKGIREYLSGRME